MKTRAFAIAIGLSCLIATASSMRAQEKKAGDRRIEITIPSTNEASSVSITVYRDGKAIVTQDLNSSVTWTLSKLERGNYEVHFEAPGFMTVVRKVVLDEYDSELRTVLPKGKDTVTIGGGPSLRELEMRIKELEGKPRSK